MVLNQFAELSHFTDLASIEGRKNTEGETQIHFQKCILLIFFPVFPKRMSRLLPG